MITDLDQNSRSGVDVDPDPTFEKNPDPGRDPAPSLEKKLFHNIFFFS